MKKLAALAAGVAVLLVAVPALAKGPTGPAGKSNIVHMNLAPYEGGPEDAWGRVKYNYAGTSLDFVLNAHNLKPDTEYVIKSTGEVLGSGMTNPAGELHINGSWACTQDLNPGRLNVREANGNARVLWTGDAPYDVFACLGQYPNL